MAKDGLESIPNINIFLKLYIDKSYNHIDIYFRRYNTILTTTCLPIFTLVPSNTVTCETIHSINTCSAILTDGSSTKILCFTSVPREPIYTVTGERIGTNLKGAIVFADDSITGVNVCLTVVSSEFWRAATGVKIHFISTSSTIQTRVAVAFINHFNAHTTCSCVWSVWPIQRTRSALYYHFLILHASNGFE